MKVCPNITALFSALQEICPINESSCCLALNNSPLSHQLLFPSSPAFQDSVASHFSTRAQQYPACIVQPKSAQDVSLAVSVLVETDDGSPQCKFAVRSGGHSTWPGAASIQDGVAIDLSKMNSIEYHAENSTASIMTGANWGSVYKALKPYGVALTGGRDETVGVGGLVLGGGFSFFVAQYGLVCDNIESYEIALANGQLVNANSELHPDLFRALKGGSNNFGIVTKINIRTFEQGDLWGGIIFYDMSTTSQQISALVNFTDHIVEDPYASLVSIWQYSSKLGATIPAAGIQYTKPVERSSAYREFLQIPSSSNSFRFTDISDLMTETAPPGGYRVLLLTLTFANDERVLQKLLNIQEQLIEDIKPQVNSEEWDIVSFLQPFPTLYGDLSVKSGGNVLGLDQMDKNHLLYLLYISWDDIYDDNLFQDTGAKLISQLKSYAQSINADNGYIYMNYADKAQNPLRSYGEDNLREILRVAKKYDPTGVFQTQVPGGFKVTSA